MSLSHVMSVLAQVAHYSGLKVRVNCKIDTTAAVSLSNKQDDVQAMQFGIPGYNDLLWDVSKFCKRYDWQQYTVWPKWQTTTGTLRYACSKISKFRRDYADQQITFASR